MDGQQVFVTGADGEQMVLSGPEAAALLAQAGISLGDQEQVMMGGGGGGKSNIKQNISISRRILSVCLLYCNQTPKLSPYLHFFDLSVSVFSDMRIDLINQLCIVR